MFMHPARRVLVATGVAIVAVLAVGCSASGTPAGRLSPPSPAVVTLAPGQQANFNVNFEDAGNYPASKCGPENATDLVAYPPGQTTPIYFAFSAQTCSSTSLVTMHVTVMQPGNGGA
jgi:hypothetical protein